jgi:hypothetical protein
MIFNNNNINIMGNNQSAKTQSFLKNGVFNTYIDLIGFIETRILYQLVPEYKNEITDNLPKLRKLFIILPNGFQKEIKYENYLDTFENPDEIILVYDNTLIYGFHFSFRFSLRYPANIKMSMKDFSSKEKLTNKLIDNTEIKLVERIVLEN